MASNKWLEKRRTFLIITGASKGLGKGLAIALAGHLGNDSVMLLLARDLNGLDGTKTAIGDMAPGVKVIVKSIDLGKPQSKIFCELIGSALGGPAADFEQAIIIHNAATMGRFANTVDMGDPQEWSDYLALNLTSPICLNSEFLKLVQPISARLVINITSGAASNPLLSAAFYNTGKAARECFFKTLAAEDKNVRVMSYSPGPLETDLYHDACKNITNPEAKELLLSNVRQGRVLTCEMAASKMLGILEKDKFESGSVVRFSD